MGSVIHDFNLHSKPVLVVSLSGKTKACDFDFGRVEKDNIERHGRYLSGSKDGTQNFSGSVIFSSCKDVLFGTTPSNRNNNNLKMYAEGLSEEMKACTSQEEMDYLQEELEGANEYINSRKLDSLSFGFIIDPETIDVQNAFPSIHNTLNSPHRDHEAVTLKAYTNGITENYLFRDKHFKIGADGEFLKRPTAQDDIDAIKKHIEKGRLADQEHIKTATSYDPNLSEILFLPKTNYSDSISAMYVDFSSRFENCSPGDVNAYLFENSKEILSISKQNAGKPIVVIFNNEHGNREMAEISIDNETPSITR